MQENPLGYAPLGSLMRKFAIPSIISMLVNSLYNMTDQIFIGHKIGMLGNAATNVAFPVTMLLIAFAQLIGVGTAANFNISLGAKRKEDAKKYIGTGLSMTGIIGLLFLGFVLLFKTPILKACGATENILPLAQTYLGITAIGLPFMLFSSTASTMIRADGSPSYSMTCTVSGAECFSGLAVSVCVPLGHRRGGIGNGHQPVCIFPALYLLFSEIQDLSHYKKYAGAPERLCGKDRKTGHK